MIKKSISVIFLLLFFALILVPLGRMNLTGEISSENRKLMVRPAFPGFQADLDTLRAYTSGLEGWLNDRIGFRDGLVALYGHIHIDLLKTTPNSQLLLGRNGHAFLASHGPQGRNDLPSLVLGLPAINDEEIEARVAQIAELKKMVQNYYGVPTAFMIIPQKHILDHEFLPYHIRKFVKSDDLAKPRDVKIIERLPSDAAGWIIFPYQEAVAENAVSRLYPQKNFHWTPGRYTKMAAAKIADHFGLADYAAPGLDEFEPCEQISDLNQFAGFEIMNRNYLCYKDGVFAGLGISGWTNITDKYPDLNFFQAYFYHQNSNLTTSPKKFLWLGDSFSPMICQDTTRYFSESLCINTNPWVQIAQRDQGDVKEQMKTLLSVYQPDYIVFSRHTMSAYNLSFIQEVTPDF